MFLKLVALITLCALWLLFMVLMPLKSAITYWQEGRLFEAFFYAIWLFAGASCFLFVAFITLSDFFSSLFP